MTRSDLVTSKPIANINKDAQILLISLGSRTCRVSYYVATARYHKEIDRTMSTKSKSFNVGNNKRGQDDNPFEGNDIRKPTPPKDKGTLIHRYCSCFGKGTILARPSCHKEEDI